MAAAAAVTLTAPAGAQTLEKFTFRLNWTLYGEHAPFFVARDKGFYKDVGLDVEILEGSGSTTVAQLTANATNPVSYVDAATMMRGINAGMPIKAVGVTLQQSPMAFIYRADNPRPSTIDQIKDSRIAITAGDASLAIFTAFMGKLNMKVSDVKLITVANPAAKEQAMLGGQADALLGYFMDQGPRMQLKSGVKMGWTRLTDMAGITTLSSAIIVNNDWVKDPKNLDQLKRFLAASQRGWEDTRENVDEAAAIFMKAAPVLQHRNRAAGNQRHAFDHQHQAHPGQAAVLVGQGRLAGEPGFAGEVRRPDRAAGPRQVLHQRISGARRHTPPGRSSAKSVPPPRVPRGGISSREN